MSVCHTQLQHDGGSEAGVSGSSALQWWAEPQCEEGGDSFNKCVLKEQIFILLSKCFFDFVK